MKSIRRLIFLTGAAAAVVNLLICPSVWAQTTKKVVVVPFVLYASEDLSYLQKGISQMLISRLTKEDKVEVIQADPAMAKSAKLNEKAIDMGGDYLVSGSLTMLGTSVSTDAKVVDLQQGKQVISFNRTGKDPAAIIEHVDQLAAEMNTKLFERKTEMRPNATATTPVPATDESKPSIYQHPEKLLKQPNENGRISGARVDADSPASLMMKGRRVKFQMRGVTTGDVDGDGRDDIVCIGPSQVVVYGIEQQQLVKLAETKTGSGNYLGVDALDVDKNGKAEIFVTGFDNRESLATSFVLEMDEKKLVRVADNLNWFFRAVVIPNRGKILAGQRQGIGEPFASTMHEIGRQGGTYGPVDRLPLPRNLPIYGFAYGSIRSPHDTDIVAYNTGGFVRILNRRGGEEWVTSERYGGSHVFTEFPNPDDRSDRLHVYLSPRIHLHDMDGDGLQEIFVISNKNIAGALTRTRLFKKGHLEALKWDDLGMMSYWRTRELAKYISDFALADMNGDGKPEVIASVVQKSGFALSKAHSFLAVFNLSQQSESVGKQ